MPAQLVSGVVVMAVGRPPEQVGEDGTGGGVAVRGRLGQAELAGDQSPGADWEGTDRGRPHRVGYGLERADGHGWRPGGVAKAGQPTGWEDGGVLDRTGPDRTMLTACSRDRPTPAVTARDSYPWGRDEGPVR